MEISYPKFSDFASGDGHHLLSKYICDNPRITSLMKQKSEHLGIMNPLRRVA